MPEHYMQLMFSDKKTIVIFLKELTYLSQNCLDQFNAPRIQLQHFIITCVHVIIDVFFGRHYHHNDLPSFYIKSQSRHHVWDPTPHNTPRVGIGMHTKTPPRYKSHLTSHSFNISHQNLRS